jgi:hypothetical protein
VPRAATNQSDSFLSETFWTQQPRTEESALRGLFVVAEISVALSDTDSRSSSESLGWLESLDWWLESLDLACLTALLLSVFMLIDYREGQYPRTFWPSSIGSIGA